MSGLKESSFSLEREQKDIQKALGDISRISGVNQGLKAKVEAMLNALRKGVKETFPSEIGSAERWLRQLDHSSLDHMPGMGSRVLRSIAGNHQKLMDNGRQVHDSIVDVAENKQNAEARSLLKKNESLSVELDGQRDLLDKWRPGKYKGFKEQLEVFSGEINRGEFPAVTAGLEKIKQGLNSYGNEASILEKHDQERRFVLDALAEVCSEMGWKAMGDSVLEDSNDPESALLYEVNTYTAGKMEFRFTLEGISVQSPISSEKNVCHSEFDSISTKLRNFGVNTKFERVNEHGADPHLLQRGELDLPDDGVELEIER